VWKDAARYVDLIKNALIHVDHLPVVTSSPANQDTNLISALADVTVREQSTIKFIGVTTRDRRGPEGTGSPTF